MAGNNSILEFNRVSAIGRGLNTHAVRSPNADTIEEKCSPTVRSSNGG